MIIISPVYGYTASCAAIDLNRTANSTSDVQSRLWVSIQDAHFGGGGIDQVALAGAFCHKASAGVELASHGVA